MTKQLATTTKYETLKFNIGQKWPHRASSINCFTFLCFWSILWKKFISQTWSHQ